MVIHMHAVMIIVICDHEITIKQQGVGGCPRIAVRLYVTIRHNAGFDQQPSTGIL